MIEYMTPKDVAAELKCSLPSARKIMRSMPHIAIGGQKQQTLRVDRRDFEQAFRDRKTYVTAAEKKKAKAIQRQRDQLIRDGILTPDGKIPRRRPKHA